MLSASSPFSYRSQISLIKQEIFQAEDYKFYKTRSTRVVDEDVRRPRCLTFGPVAGDGHRVL